MACEANINDKVTITPSLAAPTDRILFQTDEGTMFFREWAKWLQTTPDDIEVDVIEEGGDIENGTANHGDTSIIVSAHVGWRTRVYRNYLPQSRNPLKETYYSFDIATGEYTFIPALSNEEFLQLQAY
jgi:hypothetical protein